MSPLPLLNKIVLEMKYRGRSFEVNQSTIDVSAIFQFSIETIINAKLEKRTMTGILRMKSKPMNDS